MVSPMAFTTRPEIEGIFGVVATTHWIATAVGMSMLEKGGNAFDAAVATAFTLHVVEPHLNGPAGDVPVLIYDVRLGKPLVICGQGPAPRAASIATFRSLGLDMVPGSGLLAACVPGMFETWMLLLRDHGTLPLREVLSPAIFYAREGQPLVERASAMWSRGFVAEAIDAFCREQEAMDSSGTPHRGLLTADDMASWTPTVEP